MYLKEIKSVSFHCYFSYFLLSITLAPPLYHLMIRVLSKQEIYSFMIQDEQQKLQSS